MPALIDGYPEDRLLCRLVSGEMGIATVHAHNAAGVIVLHVTEEAGKLVMGIPYLAGKVRGGFLLFMRMAMAQVVAHARKLGVSEVRLGGRDWSRVFPDFEAYDGNRLRKVL
jgi:hypothetical protein